MAAHAAERRRTATRSRDGGGAAFRWWSPAGQPADAADDLRLGLSLPDKRRIGVHVASSAAVTHAGPPALAAVLASAPAAWWPLLASVLLAADALGVPVHVFGSLAWQHWSGQRIRAPRFRHRPAVRPASLDGGRAAAGRVAVPLWSGRRPAPRRRSAAAGRRCGRVAGTGRPARPADGQGPRDVTLRDHAAVAALFSEFPA